MDTKAIYFYQVTKVFAQYRAIHEVSLSLENEKTHVLLGQSGSGKSTLLRLAAGLLSPDQGSVKIRDQESANIPDKEKAQVFGYMIQDGGLFPHLSCQENILLPARVHGLSRKTQDERIQTLCQMVGLEPGLITRLPRELSGGQRQRVALMRALILDPTLIFLDEPLGALDPIVRSELQQELRDIFKRLRKTVILVTHDLAEAAYFADTITLLKDGQIEQHGSLQELMLQPKSKYVEDYFKAQRPPPDLAHWAEREL